MSYELSDSVDVWTGIRLEDVAQAVASTHDFELVHEFIMRIDAAMAEVEFTEQLIGRLTVSLESERE